MHWPVLEGMRIAAQEGKTTNSPEVTEMQLQAVSHVQPGRLHLAHRSAAILHMEHAPDSIQNRSKKRAKNKESKLVWVRSGTDALRRATHVTVPLASLRARRPC